MVLFLSANTGFASFPVQKKETSEIIVKENTISPQKNEVKKSETASMSASEDYVSPAAGSGKSQVVALILVLLVGALGIHRFYLGYTWQGVVQLLTLGGLGIWALIDLIRIVTGDLKPKDGEYTTKL